MSSSQDRYEVLKKVVLASRSSVEPDQKIPQVLETLAEAFGAERCLFVPVIDESEKKGSLNPHPEAKEPFLGEDQTSFHVPLWDEDAFYGHLRIELGRKVEGSSETMELLRVVSKIVAATMREVSLGTQAEKALLQLHALSEMGRAVTSTLNLEDLLPLILQTGLKILRAKGAVLRLEDPQTHELKVRCSQGAYDQNPLDERIAKRVFFSQTLLSFEHRSETKPSLSVLCAPLVSRGKSIGTLTFYEKEAISSRFDERDSDLLRSLANQVSCAIENALIHHETSRIVSENEKRIHQLSTLCQLNKALLTTVSLERILRRILTAITLGEGFGLNRAMLFLVDEKNRILRGKMAVGPDSAEEAGRIWESLSQRKSLLERIAELEPFHSSSSRLDAMVKKMEVSLDGEDCILARTVLEGKAFNIRFSGAGEGWLQNLCERGCRMGTEVGCSVGTELSHDGKRYGFATIPVWGKGRVIGVILVDNVYNGYPITDEDVEFLSMFSSQAGLAIENALLYRNLEDAQRELEAMEAHVVQREKMAALGELSANLAHEIKNPLVAIGGFARRLQRAIPGEGPERRYALTIIEEVNRLEKILNQVLTYSRKETGFLEECDLHAILESSIALLPTEARNGPIQIVRAIPDDLPPVKGDRRELQEAFFHLMANAKEAMEEGGVIYIRAYSNSENGSSWVRVEVEDSGKGIRPEVLHNIFNPFFTTKESSLGLGLPIVHKIVTSHGGQIEVDNRPGQGVTFIVTLPASERRGQKADFIEAQGRAGDLAGGR